MHLKVNTKRLVKANGLALGSRINQPRNKKKRPYIYDLFSYIINEGAKPQGLILIDNGCIFYFGIKIIHAVYIRVFIVVNAVGLLAYNNVAYIKVFGGI